MRRAALAALAGVLAAATLVAGGAPEPAAADAALASGAADPRAPDAAGVVEPRVLDLAAQGWTRDGLPPEREPEVAGEGALRAVRLPCERMGARWGTVFETPRGATARVALDYVGAPDGPLFEVVLDGQRLAPLLDGWRPSPRALSADLGSAWLGEGEHLLELVPREQAPGAATVRAARLTLKWL